MKQFVDMAQSGAYFLDWWRSLEKGIFKCETRQEYIVADEEELLSMFRDGRLEELRERLCQRVEGEDSTWRDIRARKLEYVRVHVVELPLNEYLRFEIEAYVIQEKGGEQIFIVDRSLLPQAEQMTLKDFLIFDNKRVAFPTYVNGGVPTGVVLSDEVEDIEEAGRMRSVLLGQALALRDFIGKYG